jgi:hypothetical protein
VDEKILAVITTKGELVRGGGAPIFIAETVEKLAHRAFLLEKIMDAMAHQLDESTYIIVKH